MVLSLDCSAQKPYLEKWRNGPKQLTGLSLNQPVDDSWWKVAVIKWGQIDFIH